MAVAYSKEFLIDVFVSRYASVYKSHEDRKNHRDSAEALYDRVGKDKFRVYASVDAEAVRKFKLACAT